jgi:pimeloyl-ACP methyl ester carboxylesterase
VINADGAIVFESIHTIERWSKTMFGILSEPGPEAPRSDLGVLFLNAGGVRHTGPNRMWVEAARRCAARGVTSLRVDLQGIGESDGEELLDIPSLYQNNLVEQAEIAMESLRFRMGCRQFAAIGLCSGAFWAFHLAIRNPDVRAAILLNPSLFFWDPETVRRRLLHRIVKWKNWHRVVRGQVRRQDFKRAARIVLKGFRANGSDDDDLYFPAEPETMSQAWRALERNRTQLTFLFAEGEPLLREMEDEGLSSNSSLVRCIRIPNVGHTFRPLWAQKLAHEHIDQEIDRVLREDQPHSVSKTNLSAVFHP